MLFLHFLHWEIIVKAKDFSRSISLGNGCVSLQWLQYRLSLVSPFEMKSKCVYINHLILHALITTVLIVTLMNIFISIYLFYVYMCVSKCMYVYHICSGAYTVIRVIECPGTELQMVVNHGADAGNLIHVFHKNS